MNLDDRLRQEVRALEESLKRIDVTGRLEQLRRPSKTRLKAKVAIIGLLAALTIAGLALSSFSTHGLIWIAVLAALAVAVGKHFSTYRRLRQRSNESIGPSGRSWYWKTLSYSDRRLMTQRAILQSGLTPRLKIREAPAEQMSALK